MTFAKQFPDDANLEDIIKLSQKLNNGPDVLSQCKSSLNENIAEISDLKGFFSKPEEE